MGKPCLKIVCANIKTVNIKSVIQSGKFCIPLINLGQSSNFFAIITTSGTYYSSQVRGK
jgi:hypothetical protein